MLSPGPTARRAHPHHPGGPRSAVALGILGHFPALRINGLQSAASRHSRPELRLHCPPCPELGLAAAKDAERSAVPVNTRESGGRACRACPCVPVRAAPGLRNVQLFSEAAVPRPFPPRRLGAAAARVLVAFTSGPWTGPQRRLVCLRVAAPAARPCAYLRRAKRSLQLVPGFKLSSSFAYY